jgi:peroxiredoxin
MKTIVFLLLLVSLSVSFVRSQEAVKNHEDAAPEAPAFAIKDLDGKEFKLDNYKGKVVLIFFWATWCPYCAKEIAHLENEVWQKYKSDDFVILGIAYEETNEEISLYRKNNKITFPLAADTKGEIFKSFAASGVPQTYLIDRKGKVLFQTIGFQPYEFSYRKKLIENEMSIIKKEKTGK